MARRRARAVINAAFGESRGCVKAIAAEGELVGREHECATLERVLRDPWAARGGIALIAGERRRREERLAEEAMQVEKVLVLRGDAPEQPTPPYGPIAAALRAVSARRSARARCLWSAVRGTCASCFPSSAMHPRAATGRRSARPSAARSRRSRGAGLPSCSWTICIGRTRRRSSFCPRSRPGWPTSRVLILGAYRSDELARGHPLRAMRADLAARRPAARASRSDPLDPKRTAELATRVLGCGTGAVARQDRLRPHAGRSVLRRRAVRGALHGRTVVERALGARARRRGRDPASGHASATPS